MNKTLDKEDIALSPNMVHLSLCRRYSRNREFALPWPNSPEADYQQG